ncbi:hypothetical protein B0I21_10675 [Sphingobacterium paludis]|uniref:Uncharacterized protein n=1 Tax=Sphingobacterium paludis TaxID=1476465 RepID=A0A4R7CVL6_9SPHI|nr:hypothetical protein B0I21_10675 [Sphingobacterium paludis]
MIIAVNKNFRLDFWPTQSLRAIDIIAKTFTW